MYNTKNKLQATDFTPAESNLAKDLDSKITAKYYCPDPGRFIYYIGKALVEVLVEHLVKRLVERLVEFLVELCRALYGGSCRAFIELLQSCVELQ